MTWNFDSVRESIPPHKSLPPQPAAHATNSTLVGGGGNSASVGSDVLEPSHSPLPTARSRANSSNTSAAAGKSNGGPGSALPQPTPLHANLAFHSLTFVPVGPTLVKAPEPLLLSMSQAITEGPKLQFLPYLHQGISLVVFLSSLKD